MAAKLVTCATGHVVGSGDEATRLGDHRAVRALLLYLGPADQSGAIRGDDLITDEEQRAKLLDQEKNRLVLKGMLGSGPDEDLTKGLTRTEGDQRFVDELGKRVASGRGDGMYLQLRGTRGGDAPSPLRALWMLEGWIGTDHKLGAAVNAAKGQVDDMARQARDRVQPTRYQRPSE